MSISATVENDIIKLPDGVHLPNGTPVWIETMQPQSPVRDNDPIYLLHEHAPDDPNGAVSDREMDRVIYGE